MKPEFNQYRTKLSERPTSVRLPQELSQAIELIAALENDSLSGIMIEGLARVVNDRRSDSEYVQSLLQAQAAKTSAILDALGFVVSDPQQKV